MEVGGYAKVNILYEINFTFNWQWNVLAQRSFILSDEEASDQVIDDGLEWPERVDETEFGHPDHAAVVVVHAVEARYVVQVAEVNAEIVPPEICYVSTTISSKIQAMPFWPTL